MARNPPGDDARRHFAALLARHLAEGTRPATAAGEPWTYAGFAAEVQSTRAADDFVSPRSVSNWCKGQALPNEITSILRALFGPSDRHAAARGALNAAFRAAHAEKAAAQLARTKPDPAGIQWVARGDQFVQDKTTRPTDRRAADDPLRRQLQSAIRQSAETLVGRSKRLANSPTWGDMAPTAQALQALLDADPQLILERLGEAYALMLRLGGFLETDIRVQRDPALGEGPLDPEIHGLLSHLVRLAAPWLRGFPTVAAWDDAAGKALLRAELFQPARDFVRIARRQETIAAEDAAQVELLATAADAGDFPGQKAGSRAVGSARNLMLAAAERAAAAFAEAATKNPAARPLLLRRAIAALTAAESEVEAMAATLPDDLRHALLALVDEGRRPDEGFARGVAVRSEPDIPEDVEAQARALILQGHAPPAAWRPFIRGLEFFGTKLDDLKPLAGLTGLQELGLSGTQVSDVSPLAHLSNLTIILPDGEIKSPKQRNPSRRPSRPRRVTKP